jgi:hypothetical protein
MREAEARRVVAYARANGRLPAGGGCKAIAPAEEWPLLADLAHRNLSRQDIGRQKKRPASAAGASNSRKHAAAHLP